MGVAGGKYTCDWPKRSSCCSIHTQGSRSIGTRGGGGGQGHRALRVEVRGTWEGLQKERVREIEGKKKD